MRKMTESFKGKTIVLTRSAEAGGEWERELRKKGAIVHRFPTIETAAVKPTKRLRGALRNIHGFDWIVFTSAVGPYFLRDAAKGARVRLSKDALPRIAAIGRATATAVRAVGWRVAFTPSAANSMSLAKKLPVAPGGPVLLLRANIASKELPRALVRRGARVKDIPIYRTKLIRRPDARFSKLLLENKIDMLTFASPSAVRGFRSRVKGAAFRKAVTVPAAALGGEVRRALKDAGFLKIVPFPRAIAKF